MSRNPIDALLRGSSVRGATGRGFVRDGLIIERRWVPPVERTEEDFGHHWAILWRGQPIVADRKYRRGRFTRVVKRPGTLSLGSAGLLAAVRPQTPYDVISCVIDPPVAERMAEELEEDLGRELLEHLGIQDTALASLLELAALEADEAQPNGRLYGDSLAHAIISRFMRLALTAPRPQPPTNPLPAPRLRRLLDRMHADFDRDLGLGELAALSGFSRAHFLRMFRAATGKTPHRYLHELRLDQARRRLESGVASITEIALACGFSSHSHLTEAFRRHFGTTPSRFRSSTRPGGG